jgi:hypothetical protein
MTEEGKPSFSQPNCVCVCVCVLLGFELKVSHLLGRCSTTWVTLLALHSLVLEAAYGHICAYSVGKSEPHSQVQPLCGGKIHYTFIDTIAKSHNIGWRQRLEWRISGANVMCLMAVSPLASRLQYSLSLSLSLSLSPLCPLKMPRNRDLWTTRGPSNLGTKNLNPLRLH